MAESKKGHKKDESHSAHKSRRKRRKQQSMPIAPILIGVLLVVALSWVVYSNLSGDAQEGMPTDTGEESQTSDQEKQGQSDEDVLAKVNDAEISVASVKEQYEVIPQYMRASVTYEDILNSTIDKTLLTQKAEEKGISVTDQQVEALLQQFMEQRDMTREKLEQQLAANNMSYQELREDYKQEMMIQQVLNQSGVLDVTVSDEAVQEYYDNNKGEAPIHVPKQIRVRHIQVNDSATADEVMQKLKEGQSFEALAQEYSMHTQSAADGGSLGYIEASRLTNLFGGEVTNMTVDDSPKILEQQSGYHVVDVTGIREERTKELSEVRDTIEDDLSSQKQQQAVNEYVNTLREEADLKIYWDRLPEEPEQESPAIKMPQGGGAAPTQGTP